MSKKIFDMGKNQEKYEWRWHMLSGHCGINGELIGDVPDRCPHCGAPNYKENYRNKFLEDERRRIQVAARIVYPPEARED